MSGSAAFTLDQRLAAVQKARVQHAATLTGGARAQAKEEKEEQRAALENISKHLSSLGQEGGAPLEDLRHDQMLVAEEIESLGAR